MVKEGEETIRVRFQGHDLWWLKAADGSGPLAPLEHADEAGNIKSEYVFSDSFAHVMPNGIIMQYRKPIGTVDDLERPADTESAGQK